LRILDFRFWIDSTDKSRGGYHQEILGHNDLIDVAGDRYAATLRKFAKLVDESS
jgi:hypothetical protein